MTQSCQNRKWIFVRVDRGRRFMRRLSIVILKWSRFCWSVVRRLTGRIIKKKTPEQAAEGKKKMRELFEIFEGTNQAEKRKRRL